MDEKPRIVAYKLIIDANIVKHRGRTERQNIVHAMEANIADYMLRELCAFWFNLTIEKLAK
jgi:hypothetical protein